MPFVHAVGRTDVKPLAMPTRFCHEIAFFMTPGGEPGVPKLGPREYWIRRVEAERWLDEGSVRIVSPLDSENQTEIELSEEQEEFLEWLLAAQVEHVVLVGD